MSATRLAIFAVIATIALSVAACGTSHTESTGKPSASASPTSAAPKPPPAPPMGKDHVEGLVRSVSGNTIQLTQRDRTAATVDVTPKTMVTQLTPAQLTDVTPGSCVDVAAASASAPPGGGLTAQSVTISPAVGGNCPPAAPPAPGSAPGVHGAVASVSGNTISVKTADPTGKNPPTNVTVTDTTSYTKHAVTNPQAITQGTCMAAQGTNSDGALQAASIDLEPCPPMGRPHHHFHIPHPHHHHH